MGIKYPSMKWKQIDNETLLFWDDSDKEWNFELMIDSFLLPKNLEGKITNKILNDARYILICEFPDELYDWEDFKTEYERLNSNKYINL